MGYLTYKAEKGAFHALWYFIKIALLLAVLLWPLAIGEHSQGHPSVLGWVLGGVWWLVCGGFAVLYGASRKDAARRR